MASYLRITPEHGMIEIGNIWFGTPMQRTTAATEAIFLLARNAFDDARLPPARVEVQRAECAVPAGGGRFGFRFEGVFRAAHGGQGPQPRHGLVRDHRRRAGRRVRAAFEAWLSPSNFDADGRQRAALKSASGLISG